jgi:hypothetical protein
MFFFLFYYFVEKYYIYWVFNAKNFFLDNFFSDVKPHIIFGVSGEI